MPSNTNYNQTHPFWDFIANMQEQQANQAPRAEGEANQAPRTEGDSRPAPPTNPWESMPWEQAFSAPWAGFWGPPGAMPYRGRRGGHHGPPPHEPGMDGPSRHGGPHEHGGHGHGPHHDGPPPPPPPPGAEGFPPPPHPPGAQGPPSRSPTPPTPEESVPGDGPFGRPPHAHGPRHGHGHGPGPRGGPHGGHRGGPRSHSRGPHDRRGGPPQHGGPPHHGGRHGEPFGGRGGRGGPFGGCARGGNGPFSGGFPFDMSNIDLNEIANTFSGLFQQEGRENANNANNGPTTRDVFGSNNKSDGSFRPSIDVFDTPSAYIIHASLPGAKKSDLDVSWNAANYSLSISGVIARPAEVDEEMVSTLTLDERQVGLFEREVRLGGSDSSSVAGRVAVDVDGISAKLEDGVLRVEVPKEVNEEWTEVRKVDVE